MPEPVDVLSAWQTAIRELGGVTTKLVTAPVGLAGPLGDQLQQQAKLVETILERQLEFDRELVGRLVAPAAAVLELADQTTAALEAQTTAFRAVATSFAQIADVLEKQAELLGLARDSVRGPISALRAARDELRPQEPAD
jgi:hypothetical protein